MLLYKEDSIKVYYHRKKKKLKVIIYYKPNWLGIFFEQKEYEDIYIAESEEKPDWFSINRNKYINPSERNHLTMIANGSKYNESYK